MAKSSAAEIVKCGGREYFKIISLFVVAAHPTKLIVGSICVDGKVPLDIVGRALGRLVLQLLKLAGEVIQEWRG